MQNNIYKKDNNRMHKMSKENKRDKARKNEKETK
jgi:hypothetical protein